MIGFGQQPRSAPASAGGEHWTMRDGGTAVARPHPAQSEDEPRMRAGGEVRPLSGDEEQRTDGARSFEDTVPGTQDQCSLRTIPVGSLFHSRFNTRKHRGDQEIQRLADRISRNGFEASCALWVVARGDDRFEVFAGGTRLEAAMRAGLPSIPCRVFPALSDEAISRLADVDNENDEYHTPVPTVDVWAEYARLRDEEGWNQERIARIKGVDKSWVSKRLKWADQLTDSVKGLVATGKLSEGHLDAITGVDAPSQLAAWLPTEQAWVELAEKAVHDEGKNGSKSVDAVRKDVKIWKEFITQAEQAYGELSSSVTLYDLEADPPTPFAFDARAAFVAELVARKARSTVRVQEAEAAVRLQIDQNLKDYQLYVDAQSSEAARRARHAEKLQNLMACVHQGNCVEALRGWARGPIRLLLTDPPYGMQYQSNRRQVTRAPERIAGDTPGEALSLLAEMLAAAAPLLDEDAHLLIFCDWRGEPAFRQVVQSQGFTLKSRVIWVKEEHSAGDLRGAFAPQHEAILHAVKGNPEVTPRIPDVQRVPRSRESGHPTEKPVALLERLISSTTSEGDLVVDPFAGSGSTLVAALQQKRRFWGAELNPEYHEQACSRLLKVGLN